jgi:hypothetical protein
LQPHLLEHQAHSDGFPRERRLDVCWRHRHHSFEVGDAKRLTDNDAFAAGIAAYAMMQSLLNQLDGAQSSSCPVVQIFEDAASSLEILITETRPKHPAMSIAARLLRESAQRRGRTAPPTEPADTRPPVLT